MRVSPHARTLLLAAVLAAAAPPPVAAQSRDPDTYVLLAGETLRANGLLVTSGDVGVNAGLLFARRPLDAPTSRLVAHLMRVSEDTTCAQAFANSVVGTGPLCGPATPFESPIVPDLPAACGQPDPFPGCEAPNAVTVTADATQPLPPGAYGEVRVLGGAAAAGTLLLEGGDYRFCTLRVARQGRVAATAPATVHVVGTLVLGNASVTGPADGAGLPADDVRLFTTGARVRIGRDAAVHALLCAPDSVLSVGHSAVLEGRFVARRIRAGRATATRVSTPTTTTTLPACGNGVVEPGEECDPPGSEGCPAGEVCDAACACAPPPTTTTTSTTTTTLAVCGDGVVGGDEACDPAGPATCAPGATCGEAGAPGACTCIEPPAEVCGNCMDDDGDGLIDFEDSACCALADRFPLEVTRGRIKSQGLTTSKLGLRGMLARSGLDGVNPTSEDVFLQLRPEGGTDILCAQLPAGSFRRKGRSFRFRDRSRGVASARGLQTLVVKVLRSGGVAFGAKGKRVQMRAPRQGRVQLTVAFKGPSTGPSTGPGAARNRCSTSVVAFRSGPQGRLVAP